MSDTLTLPLWGVGVFRHIFVGVPEDEDDITDLLSGGPGGASVFGSYEAYVDASNDPIIVSAHKWWHSTQTQDGEFLSGTDIGIVQ